MTPTWTAGHLPGLRQGEVAWHSLFFGTGADRLEVRVPALQPAQLAALATRVRTEGTPVLRALTVDAIVAILDAAVTRLLDRRDPVRQEAERLLPIVSGYHPEMVSLGLTSFLQTFRAPQLLRFLAEDFANPRLLDGFQPAPKGGLVRAFGPDLLVHSWAGNVPALPLWSLACGLLVKGGSLGKLPSAEPVFASLFARLLVQLHPPLADALAIVWWKGGDEACARAAFGQAEVVLAYGGNEAIAQVRAQVPVTARFLGYGHKLGLALVGRAALDPQRAPALARAAAHDLARWEQQGCYSPHQLYVQRGGRVSPRAFAQHLAAELAALQQRLPARAPSLEEGAAVSAWRQAAELRMLSDAGADLLGSPGGGWSVAYADAPLPLAPTAGGRCIQVCAVDALDEVPPLLAPHARYLQTVGLAADPAELHRLAGLLGEAGVTRIAPLGGMAAPEAGWHHDGRFNLADLVRLVEIEGAAERAADRLAPWAQEGAA